MTTTTNQLAGNLRPIAISDLRVELANMTAGEALLLTMNGRQFVIVRGDNWAQLVEEAGNHRALPLVPDEF
jgi:hypothetical protein